jgi:hypothetical protein
MHKYNLRKPALKEVPVMRKITKSKAPVTFVLKNTAIAPDESSKSTAVSSSDESIADEEMTDEQFIALIQKRADTFHAAEFQHRESLKNMSNTNTYVDRASLNDTDCSVYFIHDNGGRPFKVNVTKENITVYKPAKLEFGVEPVYNVKVLTVTKFLGYWSGFDTSHHKFHGNNLLINLEKCVKIDKYMLISNEISTFSSFETITDFVSLISGSDVSYPMAFTQNWVFMLAENTRVSREKFIQPITIANSSQLYDEYYGRITITDGKVVFKDNKIQGNFLVNSPSIHLKTRVDRLW